MQVAQEFSCTLRSSGGLRTSLDWQKTMACPKMPSQTGMEKARTYLASHPHPLLCSWLVFLFHLVYIYLHILLLFPDLSCQRNLSFLIDDLSYWQALLSPPPTLSFSPNWTYFKIDQHLAQENAHYLFNIKIIIIVNFITSRRTVAEESQRVTSIQWTRAYCGNKTALRSSYRIKLN